MEDSKVDYDDRTDPDCPTSASSVFQNCISYLGEPKLHLVNNKVFNPNIDSCLFVFSANIEEQLEARLQELGWEIHRTRPWKK